ncbi:MAG: DUF3592 domain-containing protein [Candidatus Aminicenantes bacterium]|jgi:hypothetical protein|nr:DUF3592 domain-containing protein [Candidatus Aminicenantes bacterium]
MGAPAMSTMEYRIAGFMLLVSVTAGGCALADRMSGVSDARTLQETGEPAEATILKIWDTGMTVNDDPVVRFLLEVRPAGKPVYQAETKLRISRLDIPRFQPGAVMPVRIDPRNPKHVALDIYDYGKHNKSPH